MRENEKGRKPILYKKFKREVDDLKKNKEKCLKLLSPIDNPKFVDEVKNNLVQNAKRQRCLGKKKTQENDTIQKKKHKVDDDAIDTKNAIEMRNLVQDIVIKSLKPV